MTEPLTATERAFAKQVRQAEAFSLYWADNCLKHKQQVAEQAVRIAELKAALKECREERDALALAKQRNDRVIATQSAQIMTLETIARQAAKVIDRGYEFDWAPPGFTSETVDPLDHVLQQAGYRPRWTEEANA